MGDLPIEKVSIAGATLASVLQRFSSSPGDVDGLLFGRLNPLPPPDLPDDDPSSALPSSSSAQSASITGYLCFGSPMSFYNSLGQIDHRSIVRALSLDHRPQNRTLLGWFSGRRNSALLPSMREYVVSVSLSKTLKALTQDDKAPADPRDLMPTQCVFLLLSSSSTPNQAVHSHEYRAFVLQSSASGHAHKPTSVNVVNVGPAFRGHYNSFSPESPFPWMPCGVVVKEEGEDRSLNQPRRRGAREQPALDGLAEGFMLERLWKMVGPEAALYTLELEDLYEKMLLKLEGLARLVENSSARVLEQENRNLKLRSKIARLE